ncbi:MAG: SOS response-associated peptidase [Pseudomonadota bacterium]
MPGRLSIMSPLEELAAACSAPVPEEAGTWQPSDDAAPGEALPVLVRDGADLHLSEMRWGIIPVGRVNARGRPVMETVINARSESVFDKSAFDGVRRAVVPVNGWFEWTGKVRRKVRWRIGAPDRPVMFFAAIYDVWTAPGGREVPQVATLTVAPNGDVEAYHHRMPVILDRPEPWLDGDEAAARALLRSAPDGLLSVVEDPRR